MSLSLPYQIKKYFWGDNLEQLNWIDHRKYITETLLDKGDIKSISWLLKQLSPKAIVKMLPILKLTEKSRNFWNIYLS